jgi:menaquinone-dependent protoporphyrinogen oxidase
MGDQRVLVAFANRAGSTAGIAGAVATVLRHAGFAVDCLVASEVADVTPYSAVILGSGVFVPSRRSDGGGFLARHEAPLASRPVWLFCAGPIGRGRCSADVEATGPDDRSVVLVARAVGARGAAIFGPIGLPADSDPLERLGPLDTERIRAWAGEIADELREPSAPDQVERSAHSSCRRVGAASRAATARSPGIPNQV